MYEDPIDRLRTACLEWREQAEKFRSWLNDWVLIPHRMRSAFADTFDEGSRAYDVVRATSVHLAALAMKRVGSLSCRPKVMLCYARLLDEVFNTQSNVDDAFIVNLFTSIADKEVETILERVVPDPTAAVALSQASVANDRDTGPLAVKPSPPLRLTPRRLEILKTIAASKTRFSKPRVVEAMNAQGLTTSRHTVRVELAKMTSAAWLDNPPHTRPRGYGITELGRSIMSKGSTDRSLETKSAEGEGL
jgi:hypothetical protein